MSRLTSCTTLRETKRRTILTQLTEKILSINKIRKIIKKYDLKQDASTQKHNKIFTYINALHSHYFDEVSSMRAAIYDGISGPCLGCLSDVYTGYTGGVMGVPGPIKGAPIEASLASLMQELILAGLPDLSESTVETLCNKSCNEDCTLSLPRIKHVEQHLAEVRNCKKISINVEHSFINQLSQVLKQIGCKCGQSLAEAIIVALVLRADAYYPGGIPCNATLEATIFRVETPKHTTTQGESIWDRLHQYVIEYRIV